MRWMLVLLLSGVLGLAAAISDVLGQAPHPAGWWRAGELVLNAGSSWAGLAVVCGWLVRRPLAGAIAAVVGLAVAVLGYYAYAVLLGNRAGLGLSAVRGSIEFWLVAAVMLGPLLGAAGALARRRDTLGVLAAWVLPLGIAVEMVVLRGFGPASFAHDGWLALAEAGLMAVGVIIAVAAAIRWVVVRIARSTREPRSGSALAA